ncbi:unnamed protein product [Cunninghamella echinulata]
MVNAENNTRTRSSSFTQAKPKVLRPFNTAEVKVLLLENVNETAVKAFKKQGYQVETYAKALVGDELLDKIKMFTLLVFVPKPN